MPQWEHCRIVDIYRNLIGRPSQGHVVTMTMYRVTGEVKTAEKQVPDDEIEAYWDETICQMGAQRWELVSIRTESAEDEAVGAHVTAVEYFFKRPIPRPRPQSQQA